MITKKTRLISVLVAAMMLVSLFAAFAMPAAAEEQEEPIVNAPATEAVSLQLAYDVLNAYGNLDPDLFLSAQAVDGVLEYARLVIEFYGSANLEDPDTAAEVRGAIDTLQEMVDEMELELKNEYPYFPPASQYNIYKEFGITSGYMIGSIEDLNFVAKNNAAFDASITLYFTEDIEIGEGDAANNLGIQASIDGQGHTVYGANVTNGGWISPNYGNNNAVLKNITFDNFKAEKLGTTQGLIYGNTNSDNILVENVTFNNCSVTGNGSDWAMLFGRVNTTDSMNEKIIMKNVVVTGCTLNAAASSYDGVSFLTGRHYNGANSKTHQIFVDGLYMANNRMIGGSSATASHQGLGLAFGRINTVNENYSAYVKNAIFVNNTADASGLHRVSVIVGADGSSAGNVRLENIIALNNAGMSGLVFLRDNSYSSKFEYERVYSDNGVLSYGGSSSLANPGVSTAAATIKSGDAVYAINKASADPMLSLKVNGDGGLDSVLALDGYPTVKVTFNKSNNTLYKAFYTGVDGKIIGITAADADAAAWDFEGDPLSATFAEDTVITATGAMLNCNHTYAADGWTQFDDNGVPYHKQTCANNCGYTAIRACEGELKDNGNGTHSLTCTTCGGKTETADHEFKEAFIEQDCENAASTTFTCACGYSYVEIDPTKPALGHDWIDISHNEETGGANSTHSRTCGREGCGLTESVACDFEHESFEATCLEDAYVSHTCRVCGYSYKDVDAGTAHHIWGEWYVSRYPSYSKTGITRRDCKRCDTYETQIQDKLEGCGIEFKSEGAFAGDEMIVYVNVANNPGFAGLTMEINYDADVFTLLNAEKGALAEGGYMEFESDPAKAGRLVISLAALVNNATDIEEDGAFAKLTFKVAEDAASGNYDITGKILDTSDDHWDDVPFDEDSKGIMAVIDFLWGDADGDGDCDAADVALILKYRVDEVGLDALNVEAADVNMSGTVTMSDAQLILLFLAGKYDPNA